MMDPQWLLLNLLLLLCLTFELRYTTGEGSMNCPKILGSLGHSVLLPLTSGDINWSMNKSKHLLVARAESPGSNVRKKIMSFHQLEGDSPGYLDDGYKFHLENQSLEILESKKEDEGWYLMTQEENVSVQQFCLQLELYEQVSTPEIKVLNHTKENGTCILTLACMVEKGDHVTYSWYEAAGTHPLSPANGSHLLQLTLSPQQEDNIYICTARNPISNHSQTFHARHKCTVESVAISLYCGHSDTSSQAAQPPQDSVLNVQWGLYAALFLVGIVGVIIILQVVILLLRRRGKADHHQPTVETKNLTIYSQVQKSGSVQKKPDPLSVQDPCTTIYVAASEPVPEPVQEPNSITVYARVTLPES